MCQHEPQCPAAADPRGPWAEIVVAHPEQGWYLLCNGIVLFDDGGMMLPDHRVVAPAA
ncbi:DUF5999 family protein [Lentzea terrae]|jgi:hypothetical protein|uniref:DUF5999 family protein n=1 Tax=Lentzea terrae TaxID=2200761 RepID=UPI0018E4F12D|nr:DUF5999 family protein [Lentzea terrae]